MLLFVSKTCHRFAPHFPAALGLLVLGLLPGIPQLASDVPNAQVPMFLFSWGKKGTAPGEFQIPISIALDDAGHVFVSDLKNLRIQKFDTAGKFMAEFPITGKPSGLAIGKDGHIYVANFEKERIEVLDSQGRKLREFGRTGSGDGEMMSPAGLALGPDGFLYLGDDVNRRIQKFSLEGIFVATWGKGGIGPGEFGGPHTEKLPKRFRTSGPNFLAFDSHKLLYATDGRGGRVHRFTAEGKFVSAWGSNEPVPGTFGGGHKTLPGPTGLCIDAQDRVWVAASNNRIQLFTADGQFLLGFGTKGSEPGQFRTPHGLAIDKQGRLYVVDTQNNRIQVFATQ